MSGTESNGEDVFFGVPENSDEINNLVSATYELLNQDTPTGRRTPEDIRNIENFRKDLKQNLYDTELDEIENQHNRENWLAYAEKIRKQNENLNNDLIKRFHSKQKPQEIMHLNKALENPKVKDLLLKVRDRTISPKQVFDAIKENTDLKEQITTLTRPISKRVTGTGGKSRVFRRKNKKTTSTSRRNARRTRRHRKSSTRRSTRK